MKKILFVVTVIASIFIIKDLVYSIYTLWHKNDLLVVAQKQLEREKRENLQLRIQLAEVKKPTFIEQEARNKLFLVKQGEQVVLMPRNPQKESPNASIIRPLLVWQQWVNLFFKNTY